MFKSTFISFDLKSIKDQGLWKKLIGNAAGFSMESRIFHSICIALLVLSTIYIPYNFYAGLYVSSISAFVFGLVFSYQYYLSRFKAKKHSTTIFAFTGLLIFGVNYFTNSGINGSTDLIWPIYLLLVLSISPYQEHLKWVVIYLIGFLTIHWIEYDQPSLIQHPFKAGTGQFIDRITAFPIPLFVVYIIIRFIRRSYDIEKKAAIEKTLAVENSNEQILAQKEQLEKSNSEKNKLMSIISHDLRSPLINIQHYLSLLSENEVDDGNRLMWERSLIQSANGAVEMLANLLNWSKSQMDGVEVKLATLDLKSALASTIALESLNAVKKGITIKSQLSGNIRIEADIDMLQLVVRNLLSNAVKFTPIGGVIEIKEQLLDEMCKISITDNGIGIPLDKKERIFSIKAESSFGTANEKGIGLGLVLSKEFTERQGGKIDFQSEIGKGSIFNVYFPVSTGYSKQIPTTSSELAI